jgi:hypothetical protein
MESVATVIIAIVGVLVTGLTTAITVWKCYQKARVPTEETGIPAQNQGFFVEQDDHALSDLAQNAQKIPRVHRSKSACII